MRKLFPLVASVLLVASAALFGQSPSPQTPSPAPAPAPIATSPIASGITLHVLVDGQELKAFQLPSVAPSKPAVKSGVKTIHKGGKVYRFGRKHSPPRRKLHLGDYLLSTLPPPPPTADYSAKAAVAMASIFKNDVLGDCVIADNARGLGITTGNAGTEYVYSDSQVISLYSACCGYVNGDESTDDGCDPESTFTYLVNNGFANGDKLYCWMAADGTNQTLIKQGIYLLERGSIAMDLPDAYVNNLPETNGFVWDVAGSPDPSNGHQFTFYGYTDQGLLIDTWGLKGLMTWAAVAKYAVPSADGNVYFSPNADMIVKATQLAPNGFSWATLQADVALLGGPVAPTPPPVVPPVTPPVVPPVVPPVTPPVVPPVVPPVNADLISIKPSVLTIMLPNASQWTILDNAGSGVPVPWYAPGSGMGRPSAERVASAQRLKAINWAVVIQDILKIVEDVLTPAPVPASSLPMKKAG